MNKPTKFHKKQLVSVDGGLLTGTIRNIRFDDRGEPIYTIDNTVTPDGMFVARECEMEEVIHTEAVQ